MQTITKLGIGIAGIVGAAVVILSTGTAHASVGPGTPALPVPTPLPELPPTPAPPPVSVPTPVPVPTPIPPIVITPLPPAPTPTPVPAPPAPRPVPRPAPLQQGTEVSRAQQILTLLGYITGPINGINGTQTQAAIRQFQTDNLLNIDGKVGPQTDFALGQAAQLYGETHGGLPALS